MANVTYIKRNEVTVQKLKDLGYEGSFYKDGQVVPMDEIDGTTVLQSFVDDCRNNYGIKTCERNGYRIWTSDNIHEHIGEDNAEPGTEYDWLAGWSVAIARKM